MVASKYATQQPSFRSPTGWTPAVLGTALLAWWDAEDAATISLTGALVNSWADKQNAYLPAQAISGAKPTYSATSFNGRPGLTFDGVDDELTLASQPFPSLAVPSEMWALVDQTLSTADAVSRTIMSYGGGVNSTRRIKRILSAAQNRATAQTGTGAAAVSVSTGVGFNFQGRHVIRGSFGATTTTVTVDGVETANLLATPATGVTRMRIGASDPASAGEFFTGVMNSGFIINPLAAEWTASNQTELLNFLKLRGGIV